MTSPARRGAEKAPAQAASALCAQPIRAKAVHFRASDGKPLNGLLAGQGRIAVVLANPWSVNLCVWADSTSRFLSSLTKGGFRVLLFDYRGTGKSQPVRGAGAERYDNDVIGAVAELRHLGARKVVLIGGSLSGIIVLAAARSLRPPVAGIVSLSGSGFEGTNTGKGYGKLDGIAAVKRLHVPLLFIVGKEDPDLAASRSLFKAAVASDKQLVVVPGPEHATELISDFAPSGERLRKLILKFIRDHTG